MTRTNAVMPVDPLNELGDPADAFRPGAQLTFMRTLVDIIRRQFGSAINTQTAAPFLLLQAPDNGPVYRITVSSTGAITATPVRGG